MSKALKCDRCGSYFDSIVYTDDSVVITTRSYFDRARAFTNFSETTDCIFHLCDKCQTQLEMFLKGSFDVVKIPKIPDLKTCGLKSLNKEETNYD